MINSVSFWKFSSFDRGPDQDLCSVLRSGKFPLWLRCHFSRHSEWLWSRLGWFYPELPLRGGHVKALSVASSSGEKWYFFERDDLSFDEYFIIRQNACILGWVGKKTGKVRGSETKWIFALAKTIDVRTFCRLSSALGVHFWHRKTIVSWNFHIFSLTLFDRMGKADKSRL